MVILKMEMPKSCHLCPMLDDDGDYPTCRITNSSQGYNFNRKEKRMDNCPLVDIQDELTDMYNSNIKLLSQIKYAFDSTYKEYLSNVWDTISLIHSMSDKELNECYDEKSPEDVFLKYKDNPEEAIYKLNSYLTHLDSLKSLKE